MKIPSNSSPVTCALVCHCTVHFYFYFLTGECKNENWSEEKTTLLKYGEVFLRMACKTKAFGINYTVDHWFFVSLFFHNLRLIDAKEVVES